MIAAALLPVVDDLPAWFGVVAPPFLTAFSVALCVVLERWLHDLPGVLTLPRWLRPTQVDQRR